MSTEFVLRIRFHYPSSLQELNFYDVRDSGAFYYYFVQCRQDFIHDMLHDVYHSHVKVTPILTRFCLIASGLSYVYSIKVALNYAIKLKGYHLPN